MSIIGRIHSRTVFGHRVERLVYHLDRSLPLGASVLDVGCGDGSIAKTLMDQRPDLRIEGVDVLVRPSPQIPVTAYDGVTLPFDRDSFNAVMLVDVLHHTDDPRAILAEAARVAPLIVVKDHLTDGFLATPTLRVMDWVGNRHHGVRLPYNYQSAREWRNDLDAVGYRVDSWHDELNLYPGWLRPVFDRRLHVVFAARVADGLPNHTDP